MKNSPKQLLSFLFLVLFLSGEVLLLAEAARLRTNNNNEVTTLFFFGDSFVDGGNTRKDDPEGAWKEPYGITFPGKPAGRFSDGRLLTDFLANYLGLESPVPYELREQYPQNVKYGMNFAVGGTGVFETIVPPNMTVQIDSFQKIIQDKVYYNASDLDHSLAYVSVAGNDYRLYLTLNNGSIHGFPTFTASVVNQTITNLIRIHSLGVKRVVIGNLQPIGCLPGVTRESSFQHCNTTFNNLAGLHNNLLHQEVTKLNQQVKVNTTFLIVDLYGSFMSVLDHPRTYNFNDQLVPCCVGTSIGYSCGGVDVRTNEKRYKVCDDPTKAFFWDLAHPTQAGWYAIFNNLQAMNSLQQLKY